MNRLNLPKRLAPGLALAAALGQAGENRGPCAVARTTTTPSEDAP